jgi:hypothetical protein
MYDEYVARGKYRTSENEKGCYLVGVSCWKVKEISSPCIEINLQILLFSCVLLLRNEVALIITHLRGDTCPKTLPENIKLT